MLSDADKQAALAHLNAIGPDTFDEGEFGPWKFTNITREGDQWTLDFTNSEGPDCVGFTFAAACVDESGGLAEDWFEEINVAILDWEADQIGE